MTICHRQVFLFFNLIYLPQILYLGKLSRPRYQQKIKQNHENFAGRCDFDYNIYLSKQCGTRSALCRLLDKGWKLESIDSLLKTIRKTGTIVRQPGSGRPYSARNSGGPCAQSGGQATKASVNSLKLSFSIQVYTEK